MSSSENCSSGLEAWELPFLEQRQHEPKADRLRAFLQVERVDEEVDRGEEVEETNRNSNSLLI